MSAHTKGPWKIDPRCTTHVISDRRPICSAGGYANNAIPSNVLADENEANALLIAAAPEMLEALRAILADINDAGGTAKTGLASRIVDDARAAIAKAGAA